MAYISYKDLPIYFNTTADTTSLPSISNHHTVFCQQVQLNYAPNIAPTRLLGKEPGKDNFNLAGPPNASLSFSAYIGTGEFNPTDYTGDVGDDGGTLRIGDVANGIEISGAFLTSFSYTLAPYAPVLVQCDFAIYKPLEINQEGGKIVAETSDISPTTDFSKYGHGAYSTFNGSSVLSDMQVFESVQYQFQCGRLPVYEIGSFFPSVVEYLTAEQSIQIQGDNIEALVPLTGKNPGSLSMTVKSPEGQSIFTSTIDGRITAENISISAGDLARGNVTITELLK
ncbi:MAG: hypothetical protein ACPGTG_08215 [Flavobacteriales bacterium]